VHYFWYIVQRTIAIFAIYDPPSLVSFQKHCACCLELCQKVVIPFGEDAHWYSNICAWCEGAFDEAVDVIEEMLDDALSERGKVLCGVWGCSFDDGVGHGLLDLGEGFDG